MFVIFLDVIESTRSVRYFAQVGDRVPVYASSVGRAILAQLPHEERRAIYRKIKFEGFSATTPMSAEIIENELRAAQERDFH
ncbi:MAG: IclR family transcriptional regulator C-terminal domain-containing protein [Xanthobacteraceae bacterium]